jgi:hypothetical protein
MTGIATLFLVADATVVVLALALIVTTIVLHN